MLAFTPAVESALRWFDATHDVEVKEAVTIQGKKVATANRVTWRRTTLPGPGGLSDQDPLLMQALDLLRHVHNDMARPKTKKTDDDE